MLLLTSGQSPFLVSLMSWKVRRKILPLVLTLTGSSGSLREASPHFLQVYKKELVFAQAGGSKTRWQSSGPVCVLHILLAVSDRLTSLDHGARDLKQGSWLMCIQYSLNSWGQQLFPWKSVPSKQHTGKADSASDAQAHLHWIEKISFPIHLAQEGLCHHCLPCL